MTEETHSDAFLQSAMETWGDTVYRLALNQTRSPVDADDVFQDVFLRLYNDTTKFESQTHLKAWLLRVTINRCLDVRRSGWKQRNTPLGEAQYRIPSPVADLY
ncbi:MAG: RNA polymerase sigma factor, partial [Raoultibacter sp.]